MSHYRQAWIGPLVSDANHDVTSSDDPEYNCVAWALGLTDRWVWPGRDDAWWPDSIRQDDSVESFIELFRSVDFERCDSAALETGYERVAVFASGERQIEADLSSATLRDRYAKEHADRRAKLAALSRERAIPVLPISTDRDVALQLRELIGKRIEQRAAAATGPAR